MDISFLQKNYFVVALAILFTVVFTFVMNVILPQKEESRSYIKTVLLSLIISSGIVYIHNLEIPIENINLDPVPF